MTYLSKDGQSHGPFTDEQIRSMQKSGEILEYQWMWQQGATCWQPIAPPPPPTPVAESAPAPRVRVMAPPQQQVQTFDRRIEAICHDKLQVISGVLERMTDEGCEFVSEAESEPAFTKKSTLLLNLLDPETGRSMNVRACMVQVRKRGDYWAYLLQWDKCPAILAS